MASIQVLTRKTGKSYRVQFMRNGNRVSKVFTRKKDAEQFLAQITVSDELADALTNVTLTREGANKSYGTRAFTGNPLILND
ncbi:hypothetical protein U1439_02280 [Aeromonas caviae]|uniref:hypothetical protein n=1 Tax=Aeromonas caviae TaxID=648 RepID=UPI003014B39C